MKNALGAFGALSILCLLGLTACGADESSDESTATLPFPAWSFEHWVWEDESTQGSAEALVNGYLERDIPVGAIIIDSPWSTGYSTFEFDTGLFPDAQAMIDGFHADGVKVMLWTVSGINDDAGEIYQEGLDNNYFLRASPDDNVSTTNWWKGDGRMVDYFNPEAVEWWHALVDKALALGIDGWKCDGLDYNVGGVGIGDATTYSPTLGRNVTRNEYSDAYYRDFYYYTREKLGDDRIITARPVDNYGFRGVGDEAVQFAPRDVIVAGWVGDQDGTFDGLINALDNLYWSSKAGYLAFGSDIGGYREDSNYSQGRSKEVFLRWSQLGAFNLVMENGGGGEHHPWAFDDETVSIYRRFAWLHHALVPYLMQASVPRWEAGTSLMEFVDDDDYAYFLGDDIFVWPIATADWSITIVAPDDLEGRWVSPFDSSKVLEAGTRLDWEVPLDAYPVFVREGSAVGETLEGILAQY